MKLGSILIFDCLYCILVYSIGLIMFYLDLF